MNFKSFTERVINVHGPHGEKWLEKINDHISNSEERWHCKALCPFALSYNYVAPVNFEDGSAGVLKLCVPGVACINEMHVLQRYDGSTMCKLTDSVPEMGILLLERLLPGNSLSSIPDDEKAIKLIYLFDKMAAG